MWGRAAGVGKRERQPERDSPTPVLCKRGEVAARVRVKRIFACVRPYTGCPVLTCESPRSLPVGIMEIRGNASEGDLIGFEGGEGVTGDACRPLLRNVSRSAKPLWGFPLRATDFHGNRRSAASRYESIRGNYLAG